METDDPDVWLGAVNRPVTRWTQDSHSPASIGKPLGPVWGALASTAYEILLALQWTPDFTDLEAETLRELHAWQRTGRNRPELPDAVERAARALADHRNRAARGEIPRTKPLSHSDRRRLRTYYGPSFRKQLGRLATETDEREVKKLIAELARQTRNRQVPVYWTSSIPTPVTPPAQTRAETDRA